MKFPVFLSNIFSYWYKLLIILKQCTSIQNSSTSMWCTKILLKTAFMVTMRVTWLCYWFSFWFCKCDNKTKTKTALEPGLTHCWWKKVTFALIHGEVNVEVFIYKVKNVKLLGSLNYLEANYSPKIIVLQKKNFSQRVHCAPSAINRDIHSSPFHSSRIHLQRKWTFFFFFFWTISTDDDFTLMISPTILHLVVLVLV